MEAERELFFLQVTKVVDATKRWTLFVDGSSNLKGTGLGVVLTSPKEDIIERVICCAFKTTNKEGEALIARLLLVKDMNAKDFLVKGNS